MENKKQLSWTLLAGLLCAVFWMGCGGNGITGSPCKEDGDCIPSLICKAETCTPEQSKEQLASEKPANEKTPTDGGGTDTIPEATAEEKQKVKVTEIEGDGSSKPVVYHGEFTEPNDALNAKKRFQKTWVLRGQNLDKLDGVELELASNPSITFNENQGLILEAGGSSTMRTIRLPQTQ